MPETETKFEILHNEGSDSIVIADTATHDDIAEVFHNERHTVTQTVEQALQTARLFAAAPELYEALQAAEGLFRHTFAEDGTIHKQMIAALAKARGEQV